MSKLLWLPTSKTVWLSPSVRVDIEAILAQDTLIRWQTTISTCYVCNLLIYGSNRLDMSGKGVEYIKNNLHEFEIIHD